MISEPHGFAPISDDVKNTIAGQKDLTKRHWWFRLAVLTSSLEDFRKAIEFDFQ